MIASLWRSRAPALLTWFGFFAIGLVAAAGLADTTTTRADFDAWLEQNRDAQPRFAAGDVITRADLEKLRPFVVPGYFAELDFPEIRIEIAPPGDYAPHPAYLKASREFAGQARVEEDGSLAGYVAGQPFSNEAIAQASPGRAGSMVAWNYTYRWQRYGQHAIRAVTMFLTEGDSSSAQFSEFPEGLIGGDAHIERSVELGWQRTYFSHLALLPESDYRFPFRGAEDATFKDMTEYYAPFEFYGQKLMIERSEKPAEDDTLNAYLPGERKVRRLSAKEKSDTWIGSEQTFDDFYGFDGRVLDNTWRYLGRKSLLGVINSQHPYPRFYGPQSRVPNDRWEMRETVVVEAIPTLEGHPYGARVLMLDAQTNQPLAALYFDPEGRLFRGSFPLYAWSETTADHPEENRGAHVCMYKGYAVINFQNGNTTLTGIVETAYRKMEPKKVRRLYRLDNLTAGR